MFWNVVLFSPGTQFNQSIIFSAVIVTVLYTLIKKIECYCSYSFWFQKLIEIWRNFYISRRPCKNIVHEGNYIVHVYNLSIITRWLIPYQLLVHELFDLRSSGEIFLGWNLIGLWYVVLAVFNKNKQNKPKLLVNSNNGWRWWDTFMKEIYEIIFRGC